MPVINLDPAGIYFTHAKIKPHFSTGKSIMDTYQEIATNKISASDIPIINVYCVNDKYYSLNNRRLYLFKMCKNNGLLPENVIKVNLKKIPSKKVLQRFLTNDYSLVTKPIIIK
jgi:hypothetical protein